MTRPGRIPCINPRCRRTASADKYPGQEIICGKCFRALPPALRRRYRAYHRRERKVLRAIERRVAKGTITAEKVEQLRDAFEQHGGAIWLAIRQAVISPERPAGLDNVLEELGLANDGDHHHAAS